MEIKIEKNKGGWAATYKAYTTRPYAIRINGDLVLTMSCAVRTFGSRESAQKWANRHAATYKTPKNPRVMDC